MPLLNTGIQLEVQDILELGWKEEFQTAAMKRTRQRRFKRDEYRIDIWASRTIAVYERAIKGIYAREVTDEDIFEVFIDPSYIKKLT